MSIFPNLFRSLLLTTFLTFTTPIIFVGGVLAAVSLLSYVPGCALLGQTTAQILNFLAIFGSGYPVQGILTIGFTGALVGSLFDLFNFYLYQSIRSQ